MEEKSKVFQRAQGRLTGKKKLLENFTLKLQMQKKTFKNPLKTIAGWGFKMTPDSYNEHVLCSGPLSIGSISGRCPRKTPCPYRTGCGRLVSIIESSDSCISIKTLSLLNPLKVDKIFWLAINKFNPGGSRSWWTCPSLSKKTVDWKMILCEPSPTFVI